MIIVPVMANIFGAKASTGILLILLIQADLFGVYYYNIHADIKKLIRLIPSTAIGVITAVLVGEFISAESFQLLLGTIIVLGIVLMLIGIDVKKSKIASVIIGYFGGFVTMFSNAAGSILSIYFLSMGFDKNKFIGTAAWFFFLVNLFKVPFHTFVWHTFSIEILLFDLALYPFILIGAILGVWIVKKIPERPFKIFVIISVLLSTINLFL